jgi:hypothetical protein
MKAALASLEFPETEYKILQYFFNGVTLKSRQNIYMKLNTRDHVSSVCILTIRRTTKIFSNISKIRNVDSPDRFVKLNIYCNRLGKGKVLFLHAMKAYGGVEVQLQ